MENQGITIAYQLECLLEKARNESFACIFLSAGRSDDHGQISLMAGFGVSEKFEELSDHRFYQGEESLEDDQLML